MMFLPATGNPMAPFWTTGLEPTVDKSSRYSVISRVPTGTGVFSMRPINSAKRCANGTPRRRMPTMPKFSAPLFFSLISWANRTTVLSISEPDISCDFSFMELVGELVGELAGELADDLGAGVRGGVRGGMNAESYAERGGQGKD